VTAVGAHSSPSAANVATRGSAIKLAAEMGSRVLSLATTVLLLRALGVEGFGVFTPLLVWAVVLAEAADLGIQGTASQALVAGTISLRSLLRAKIAITGAVLGIALLALPWAPVLSPLVAFFALAGWSELLGVVLRARGRRGHEAILIFALRASGLACVALAVSAGPTLVRLAWAHVASTIAPIALGALLVRGSSGPLAGDFGVARVLLRSAPLAVNGGLALLSLRVELLAVERLRGAWDAGLFAAALRVIEFLNMVPNAVCAGAMPALTREALGGPGGVRRRTATTLALLAAPAATGLVLVAPWVVHALDPSYEASTPALALMAVSVLPLFMNALVTHALIAAGRANRLPGLTALRVATAAVLAFVLVPRFGAVGAAAGFVASESLLLVIGTGACAAAGSAIAVLRPLTLGLAAAVPMAAAVALVGRPLVASVVVGAFVYAATLAVGARVFPRVRCCARIGTGTAGDSI
jgi:O-antigen/teichoic acid export membrane protein